MKAKDNRPLPLFPKPDRHWINNWRKDEADARADEKATREASLALLEEWPPNRGLRPAYQPYCIRRRL